MVSDFLTPRGRLAVPDTISDVAQLLAQRYATEYFVYGQDKYWLGVNMVDHTAKVAVQIFNAAVFLFNNASNHSSYAADTLRVGSMNFQPGGDQGVLQEGFMHGKGLL